MDELDQLTKNVMLGKTAYILPFIMGGIDDPHSMHGLMITDSIV